MFDNKVRKYTSMFLIVAMITSIFSVLPYFNSVAYADTTTQSGKVNVSAVYVRSGPGTLYKNYGTLKKGKSVSIRGTKTASNGDKWYLITYNSRNAYVYSKYITTGSSKTIYSTTKKGLVKSGPLSVRTGPSSSYSRVTYFAKNKTFTIKGLYTTSTGSKWYISTYNSRTVYVSANYVSIVQSSATSLSSSKVTYSPAKTGKVTGTVSVRTGPSSSYSRVAYFTKNKTISIKGLYTTTSGKKWYITTYNSRTVYVSANYVSISNSSSTTTTYSPVKKGKTTASLNVRSGPGTSYSKLTTLSSGTTKTIYAGVSNAGGKWYRITYNSKTAYISASYVTIIDSTTSSSSSFETYMTQQGFPTSYKTYLRKLHQEHPKWVFKAQQTGLSWSDVNSAENILGRSLVHSSYSSDWKSKASGAYNSTTKKYNTFDGSWNQASPKAVAYYLDPRNFLNEKSIYQFVSHKFNDDYQTESTVRSLVNRNSCYLNTSSYPTYLYNAGKNAKVNPNVITVMAIMEQGWTGGSNGSVSGHHSIYPGIYNHFNVGAYTTETMSATTRGLWWAKGEGVGKTSYGRPWNTKEKSLTGGASFFASNYTNKNQYTYYTKKFNVYNGSNKLGLHQYSTAIWGASSEGNILKYAYESNDNYPIVFYIPVYSSMPTSLSTAP